MSKAPQVQYPAVRRSFFGRAKSGSQPASVPTVAQPLTEAEAAEELAAGLRAEQERRQAKETKRAEKEASREAAKAAKAAAKIDAAKARAARTTATMPGGAGPTSGGAVRVVRGRLTVSFNTVACLVVAAGVCVMMISAYSIGRHSGGSKGELVPAAAKPAEFSATPLLPALGKPKGKTTKPEPPAIADLSRLLDKPAERQAEPGVAANSPAKPVEEETVDESTAARLNYLQIESFLITRERSGDMVVKDLEAVRQFLGERGIKTIARRHSNGYVLYSAQGFPPDRESAKQRETFRKRIEALGQEFRRSGGQYEFKGCDFVGHARTKAGQPA
jgi:hypothetical protein